jgi:hypothetical protein
MMKRKRMKIERETVRKGMERLWGEGMKDIKKAGEILRQTEKRRRKRTENSEFEADAVRKKGERQAQ